MPRMYRRRTTAFLDHSAAIQLGDPRSHSTADPVMFWTIRPRRTVLDEWVVVVTFEMANDHNTVHEIAGPYATEQAAEAFCEGFYFRETEANAAAAEYIEAAEGLEREIIEVGKSVTDSDKEPS